MRFSSRDETCDTNTPSSSSSRTSINGGIRRKSSNETIQLYRGSISNSSVHTVSTAESSDSHKDLFSESSTGQYPSIFDRKSLHSLEKPTYLLRNQSLPTICTTGEPDPDCDSDSGPTSLSTPKQEPSSLNLSTFEDEAEISLPPTPRSPEADFPFRAKSPSPSPSPVIAVPPPPLADPLMKSYGDSQLFATTEISTADTPSIRPAPFFHPQQIA